MGSALIHPRGARPSISERRAAPPAAYFFPACAIICMAICMAAE